MVWSANNAAEWYITDRLQVVIFRWTHALIVSAVRVRCSGCDIDFVLLAVRYARNCRGSFVCSRAVAIEMRYVVFLSAFSVRGVNDNNRCYYVGVCWCCCGAYWCEKDNQHDKRDKRAYLFVHRRFPPSILVLLKIQRTDSIILFL